MGQKIKCPKCGNEFLLSEAKKIKSIENKSYGKRNESREERTSGFKSEAKQQEFAFKYSYKIAPKILVIDPILVDLGFSDVYKMIFEGLLGSHDYLLDIEKTQEGALNIIKQKEYDVIFADIRGYHNYDYSKDDGVNFIKLLKEKAPKSELVVITAYATKASYARAIEYGAMEYIRKPFLIEEIEEILVRALRKKYGTEIVVKMTDSRPPVFP